jgi:hypothetical protein
MTWLKKKRAIVSRLQVAYVTVASNGFSVTGHSTSIASISRAVNMSRCLIAESSHYDHSALATGTDCRFQSLWWHHEGRLQQSFEPHP